MQDIRRQAGFGLLETLTGLIVFVLLAVVGTKAFKGVVANQKESAQIKALTDAVTVITEQLSAKSVSALTAYGSKYLSWSEPASIGSGEYHFRYRTVPRPTVGGGSDTSVVGLEVEVGSLSGDRFTAGRLFATLIAPHPSSRDKTGQVSTQAERDAEAAFYAGHLSSVRNVNQAAVSANQTRLNSYSCYAPEQCCGFMKKYFADPTLHPGDGLDEKCYYRCAMGGNVSVKSWNSACDADFCAIAPWQTKEQCCADIQAGLCEPGSVCANVCIGCLGEDGSTCGPPICDIHQWNDFFDCANEQFCDGTPLPEGVVEGWGDIRKLCKNPDCAAIPSECDYRPKACCMDYWGVINSGKVPDPKAEICKTISNPSECCNLSLQIWDWDQIKCGTDGKVVTAHNRVDGKWYCGMQGDGWDKACAQYKGCGATYNPPGSGNGGCGVFPGRPLDSPWIPTYPNPNPPKMFFPPPGGSWNNDPINTRKTSMDALSGSRVPSTRNGNIWGSFGGRE